MAGSGENTHDMTKLIKIIFGDYTIAVFKRALPLCIFVSVVQYIAKPGDGRPYDCPFCQVYGYSRLCIAFGRFYNFKPAH